MQTHPHACSLNIASDDGYCCDNSLRLLLHTWSCSCAHISMSVYLSVRNDYSTWEEHKKPAPAQTNMKKTTNAKLICALTLTNIFYKLTQALPFNLIIHFSVTLVTRVSSCLALSPSICFYCSRLCLRAFIYILFLIRPMISAWTVWAHTFEGKSN